MHTCHRVALGALAFVVPPVCRCAACLPLAVGGCLSPQPPVGQDFPFFGLMFLLSHCRSCGLAPAKPVMWLWWVLIGSDCGSGRITCLSPASSAVAWGPNNTHARSVAVGQHTPAPASTRQSEITALQAGTTDTSLTRSQSDFLQGTFWGDPAALEGNPGEAARLGTPMTSLPTGH